jgi:hypothetical protein
MSSIVAKYRSEAACFVYRDGKKSFVVMPNSYTNSGNIGFSSFEIGWIWPT